MKPEDNDLLVRVEGDAPMGRMFRENFWTPAMRAKSLEAGGSPVRVRLLGKNYVAFRASDGRVGFLDEACPHRGVSLALGRNEDCALRCIFHGWKIHVTGKLIEVPNEHTEPEKFISKVKVNTYSVREAGGVIWVWLGSREPAMFPEYEFMKLPDDHVAVFRQPTKANWFQCLEGVIDSSHLGVLHKDQVPNFVTQGISFSDNDNAPVFDVDSKPFGIEASAMRTMSDGSQYARITSYVAPYITFIPPNGDGDRLVHISIPHDDTSCSQIVLYYNVNRRPEPQPWYGEFADPDNFAPLHGDENNYWGQNRKAMQDGTSYSGYKHLFSEDLAVQESAGVISNRAIEHLCSGDVAIVRARRFLLQAVRSFQEGKDMPFKGLGISDYEIIKSRCSIVPKGTDWRTAPAVN